MSKGLFSVISDVSNTADKLQAADPLLNRQDAVEEAFKILKETGDPV